MLSVKENETGNIIIFKSVDEKMEKLKEWEVISPKAKEIKTLKYKGIYTEDIKECDVIGYLEVFTRPGSLSDTYEVVIIDIDGVTHKINPVYLKEMQKPNFTRFKVSEEE